MPFQLNWTMRFFIIAVVAFLIQLTGMFDLMQFSFVPAHALSKPWTFITAMFLHANVQHIFFNMLALLMFGIPLESRIGSKKFLAIFFVSGIVGGLGYLLTAGNPLIPAIGMSGAIYGIMGTLAILMPSTMVFVGGFFPMPMIFAVFFWVISEFLGLFSPGTIARGAHLGGLLVGVLYGFYLRRLEDRDRPRHHVIKIKGYKDWEV